MKINVWNSIKQRTVDASLTSGIHDSKHAYVPKADILNTSRKLISVGKNKEIAYLVNIYHK